MFLEGFRGIYNVGAGAQKNHDRQLAALSDPNHPYHNTKENYVGRAEKIVGPKGRSKPPWSTKYPLFKQVMRDDGQFGRMWPIRCTVENNFYHGNTRNNRTEWSRVAPEAMKKARLSLHRTDPRDIIQARNGSAREQEILPRSAWACSPAFCSGFAHQPACRRVRRPARATGRLPLGTEPRFQR